MPVVVNIRHLEVRNLLLEGELPAAELDVNEADELIHVTRPVFYRIEVQKTGEGVLAQGELRAVLECECARCLKRFRRDLSWGHWVCHLSLVGDDAVEVQNDCVDLTPPMREDILLAFPQHPLCEPDCAGLPGVTQAGAAPEKGAGLHEVNAAAWAELNKLNLED